MPKVSFIVAVYNSMPYLTQCLDSLLAQTERDIEVICVNDCSPDNSLDYIKACAKDDSRIKYETHEVNKRQGGAWNTGVSMATGEYLCFVDADDWIDSDYANNALDECKNADICFPLDYYSGNDITTNIDRELLKMYDNNVFKYILLHGCFFISCFIKRDLFIENNFKFIENNMYQDLFVITLINKASSIVVFDKAGYHYRTDNVSIQRSMNQNGFWGRLEVADMTYEICKASPGFKGYEDELDYRFYNLFYRNSLIRAFYSFTELPWERIRQIKKTTREKLPFFKKNKYYSRRLEGVPKLQKLPIWLFENLPDGAVSFVHSIYLFLRRVVKK